MTMRLGLRSKLALVALFMLALPWAGVWYVNEMEHFLLQGQERYLLDTARAVATALHERPELLSAVPERDDALRREAEAELRRLAGGSARGTDTLAIARTESVNPRTAREEIAAILRGVERTESRIWIVNRHLQVLALAGSLQRVSAGEDTARRIAWWERALAWVVRRPAGGFSEAMPDSVLVTGREIISALQGTPGTRMRRTADARVVVLSAAHPVWAGNDVVGAVVVEETTNPILSLRSEALERLLLVTLLAFGGVALIMFGFASRLSSRIRRLRNEAETAIDARGRITNLTESTAAGDEIGDLSRSFSAMLARLAGYHTHLESMANRLSHELRTPIAVVRSSLENLRLASDKEEASTYIERAEDGLKRLATILQRMTEATRLEQGLRSAERERYDLNDVVRGCVEGYRIAYPHAGFELRLATGPLELEGSPDLAAQMLDKLIENAVDFSTPGVPVRVQVAPRPGVVELSVENDGPLLPAQLAGRLFDSMASARSEPDRSTPHLGLGLYVARLIAEFHGGAIEATNLPAGNGVRFEVRLPLAWR